MLNMGTKIFAKISNLLNFKFISKAIRLTIPTNITACGEMFKIGNSIKNIPVKRTIKLYGLRIIFFKSIFKDFIIIGFKGFQKRLSKTIAYPI